MPTLVALSYSPWSERARWALDHCELTYHEKEYLPLLMAPWLRWKTGRWRGRVSVPVLLAERVLTDSYEIARHAHAQQPGRGLMPLSLEAPIRDFTDRLEQAMSAGRVLLMDRMSRNRTARIENLPGFFPGFLRPHGDPVARWVLARLRSKYGITPGDTSSSREVLRDALAFSASRLARAECILDAFSFADMVLAGLLQFVEPVADTYITLGPASRQCWRDEAFASQFNGLIDWRDRLYARYRRRSEDPSQSQAGKQRQ